MRKKNQIKLRAPFFIKLSDETSYGRAKKIIKEGKINLNYKRAEHQFSLASKFQRIFFLSTIFFVKFLL